MDRESAPLENAESFSQLYARTHLHVYRFIYGMLGGPAEEIEDLTAETYLRAWASRSSFRGDEQAATGWLLRIARNLVIDSHRRRETRGVSLSLEESSSISTDPGPEDQFSSSEQRRILWSLLQELAIEQREMIVLRYMVEWPVKQIARHLGMNENTISVTLRRTLQRLQRNWPESDR